MNSPAQIHQEPKQIQSEVPRYNLISTSSNKQKTLPLRTKTSTSVLNVLPLFVMECQKAIKIHHQKEVAVRIVETVPTLLARHGSHRARPPKSVYEPPERSKHDPTYVECLNHPK